MNFFILMIYLLMLKYLSSFIDKYFENMSAKSKYSIKIIISSINNKIIHSFKARCINFRLNKLIYIINTLIF